MAAPKRGPQRRQADLILTEQMYLAGHSQAAIAKAIGVSTAQISYDIEELRTRWRERTAMNLDAKKSEELARIDRLEMEYWDAWRRSQQDFKAQTVRKAEGKAKSAEVSQHTENRYGDPRFLEGVLRCIAKRCEILGINAAIKLDADITIADDWTNDPAVRLACGEEMVKRAKRELATRDGATTPSRAPRKKRSAA